VVAGLLVATLRMTTPILFAAVGETITERSGVLNLGMEGIMLMGAIAGFIATFTTGNPWMGVLAAMLVGGLIGLIHAILSISLGVNQVVSGVSLTIFGMGMSTYIYRAYFGALPVPPSIEPFKVLTVPVLSGIPFIGPFLFQAYLLTYISLFLVVFFQFFLFKTRWGLRIRAVGENPEASDTAGIKVLLLRYVCVILGSMLAGIGGAFLPLAIVKFFMPMMTAGRGWIAVAVVIFGRWIPVRVLGGALLYGFVDALQLRLQAVGIGIPYQFFLMAPYLVVVLALTVVGRKMKPPKGLAIPYKRGE